MTEFGKIHSVSASPNKLQIELFHCSKNIHISAIKEDWSGSGKFDIIFFPFILTVFFRELKGSQ